MCEAAVKVKVMVNIHASPVFVAMGHACAVFARAYLCSVPALVQFGRPATALTCCDIRRETRSDKADLSGDYHGGWADCIRGTWGSRTRLRGTCNEMHWRWQVVEPMCVSCRVRPSQSTVRYEGSNRTTVLRSVTRSAMAMRRGESCFENRRSRVCVCPLSSPDEFRRGEAGMRASVGRALGDFFVCR